MTPLDILMAARAILAERGWRQGKGNYEQGPLCAYETLVLSADLAPPAAFNEAKRMLTDKLLTKFGTRTWERKYAVIEWNDLPGVTAEHVLTLFDETIAEAAHDLKP